ncbi:hypothetical protein [Micromonospora craniellae]|uniref:hypothetical protein n=1 Tax=Micromonospora craniellae TaxID=2294034 RepID=UPI0011C1AACC|nr:hypothetical protein [Micromonospora craniellae]QOC94226.1 hypothetical protein ID554_11845 [Micromonospora craniellae]
MITAWDVRKGRRAGHRQPKVLFHMAKLLMEVAIYAGLPDPALMKAHAVRLPPISMAAPLARDGQNPI